LGEVVHRRLIADHRAEQLLEFARRRLERR
jgi:hypothetical protein